MTDRELLTLAAKAAGIEVIGPMGDDGLTLFNGKHWNPLADDGDALRLAVILKMDIDIGGGGGVQALCGEPNCNYVIEDIEPDPLAATRRAIVRAAAEIGRVVE